MAFSKKEFGELRLFFSSTQPILTRILPFPPISLTLTEAELTIHADSALLAPDAWTYEWKEQGVSTILASAVGRRECVTANE